MSEPSTVTEFDPAAYTIIIRRVVKDGAAVYHGKVVELPDLEAFEPTYEEAYSFLVDAIQTAKEAFDEQGRGFPAPMPSDVSDYSGRVTIRMPKWLHARLDLAAQADGTSLNQYMVAILAAGPSEPVQAAMQPAPAQAALTQAVLVGSAATAARLVAAAAFTRATGRVTFESEEQPAMEPLKGSVVHGIQNVTYHASRPVFFRTTLDEWLQAEPGRGRSFKGNVVTKRRK